MVFIMIDGETPTQTDSPSARLPRRPRLPNGTAGNIVISCSVDSDTVERVDELAGSWGMSRSAYLSRLVKAGIAKAKAAPDPGEMFE